MRKFLLLLTLLPSVSAFAANHYITVSGTGAKTGVDWNNSCQGFSGNCAGSAMVRGDFYYVAGGTYDDGITSALIFSAAQSGTTLVTVKGATAADHGTATGWTSSLGVDATPATFPEDNSAFQINSGYLVIDGNTGPPWNGAVIPNTALYGFHMAPPSPCGDESNYNIGQGGDTIPSVFFYNTYFEACITSTNGTVAIGATTTTTINGLTVAHDFFLNYEDNVNTSTNTGFNTTTNVTYDHNYSYGGNSNTNNHGNLVDLEATVTNVVITNNVFRSCVGTTCLGANDNGDGCGSGGWGPSQITGNIFILDANSNIGDRIIGPTTLCWMHDTTVALNTFIGVQPQNENAVQNFQGCFAGGECSHATNNSYLDNLVYSANCQLLSGTGVTTFDYNFYSNCQAGSSPPSEAHSQVASFNPFINYSSSNLGLLTQPVSSCSSTSAICFGLAQSSPTVDAFGNPYSVGGGFPRGAIAFVSGAPSFTWTPTVTNGSLTGTNCGAGSYSSGTLIGACTPVPNAGYMFSSWSSVTGSAGCSGSVSPCPQFAITANSTATANFVAANFTLSTATAGSGSGTVSGGSCAGSHAFGSSFSCTVAPATGSTLSSVTGCGGTGSTTYTGTMPSSNCTVTATFAQSTAATPTFAPAAGSYATPQRVVPSCSTPNSTIFYTTDGSTPTGSSAAASAFGIYVYQNQTLKAICTASGYANSGTASSAYTIAAHPFSMNLTTTSSSVDPVPFPIWNRACCGSNVAAYEPARQSFTLSGFHNWINQTVANGQYFWYTIQGFPGWMTGLSFVESAPPLDLHTSALCQGVLAGVTTTDCSLREFVAQLASDRTGLTSRPSSPVTCPHLDVLEGMNEFNTDSIPASSTGWTGLYTDLAQVESDEAAEIHLWCSNTLFAFGSVSAITGSHANGEDGHFDVAMETALADLKALPNPTYPDLITWHPYPARNNVSPVPFPTTNVSNSDPKCTTANVPNSSCYVDILNQVETLLGTAVLQNPAIKSFAMNIPLRGSEGGFGTLSELLGSPSATATQFAIASSVVTVTAPNTFTSGEQITLQGWQVGTYFNGQVVTVLSTGLSASQFEFNFAHADMVLTNDSGTAADLTSTEYLRSAWTAQHAIILGSEPVDVIMDYAGNDPIWGCYWQCNGSNSGHLQAFTQSQTWIAAHRPTAACTATAVTGGNFWTCPSGSTAEYAWFDGWYPATTTQSTAFNTQQNLEGTTSATGGSITVGQEPVLLTNSTVYTFAIGTAGTGSGTTSGCISGSFPPATAIGPCSATAGTNSTFTGWSGTGSASGASGTSPYSFTLNANSTLTATFTMDSFYTLGVNVVGGGSVSGPNCAPWSYVAATVIGPCTANAASQYTFTGWSGTGSCSAATGTGTASCTLNANSTLTATFTLDTYTLSTATNGTGSGTLTCSPSSLPAGGSYSCTATASSGSLLAAISGCGGSGGAVFTGTMPAANCTVTATFNLFIAPPTMLIQGTVPAIEGKVIIPQ